MKNYFAVIIALLLVIIQESFPFVIQKV